MKSVKSVGMIPLGQDDGYTFKNWNKVDFNLNVKNNDKLEVVEGEANPKNIPKIKFHKGDFYTEIDHIQQLEMKSYKSIEKMV